MAAKKKTQAKKVAKKVTKAKKPAAKKISQVFVGFVLDRSGSMGIMAREAVDGFNQQVATLRAEEQKTGIKTSVSFLTFDSVSNPPIYVNAPLDSIKELTSADYVPQGMTAMYDGTWAMLDILEAEAAKSKKKNVAFLVIVISDGQENNSHVVSGNQLAERLQKLQKNGNWTITYQGANQDLTKVAAQLNIPTANTMAFAGTGRGMSLANSVRSVATSGVFANYSRGMSSTMDFYDNSNTSKDPADPAAVQVTPAVVTTDSNPSSAGPSSSST